MTSVKDAVENALKALARLPKPDPNKLTAEPTASQSIEKASEAPDPDPNARDSEGRTPLHLAVGKNDWTAVKNLLKGGADPNARDEKGETPLELAVEGDPWGNISTWEIVEALLEGGADPIPYDRDNFLSDDNLRDWFAQVLFRAKQRWLEQQRRPKWDRLDERDRNRRRREAWSEAGQAVELYEQLRERSERTHEQAMELVFGHLCPQAGEEHPLRHAIYEKDLLVVTLLLQAGADPNAGDITPLQIAVDSASVALPVVVTLLAAGADPNDWGSGGFTPLYYAVSRKNLAVLSVLLNAGANPNSYFRSDGSLLHAAVQNNDLAVVAALLNGGADPNAQDEWGKTPLHYAAASTSPVEETLLVIELLLNAGADPGVKDWYDGWNAVQEADHNDHLADKQKLVTALQEGGIFPTRS